MISSYFTSIRVAWSNLVSTFWDAWSILASNDSFHLLLCIFTLLFSVLIVLLLVFDERYKK